jgi:hypothetical protein
MVANTIHDPCFTIDARTVACPTNVPANTGVRIVLTKPLPQANTGGARNAWLMQLAGGITCNMGTGTVLPGYPFYCTGNLVCAAPSTTLIRHAVFVQCGRPRSAVSVTRAGHYLVETLYQ